MPRRGLEELIELLAEAQGRGGELEGGGFYDFPQGLEEQRGGAPDERLLEQLIPILIEALIGQMTTMPQQLMQQGLRRQDIEWERGLPPTATEAADIGNVRARTAALERENQQSRAMQALGEEAVLGGDVEAARAAKMAISPEVAGTETYAKGARPLWEERTGEAIEDYDQYRDSREPDALVEALEALADRARAAHPGEYGERMMRESVGKAGTEALYDELSLFDTLPERKRKAQAIMRFKEGQFGPGEAGVTMRDLAAEFPETPPWMAGIGRQWR